MTQGRASRSPHFKLRRACRASSTMATTWILSEQILGERENIDQDASMPPLAITAV